MSQTTTNVAASEGAAPEVNPSAAETPPPELEAQPSESLPAETEKTEAPPAPDASATAEAEAAAQQAAAEAAAKEEAEAAAQQAAQAAAAEEPPPRRPHHFLGVHFRHDDGRHGHLASLRFNVDREVEAIRLQLARGLSDWLSPDGFRPEE